MFRLQSEEMASFVHQFYLDLAEEEGWTPNYPMSYKKLPEDIKLDNIAAARRIPEVLSLAGLIVSDPGHGPAGDPELVKQIIEEDIELLAEAEHDGWMEFKCANGWAFAEKRDDSQRKHPLLIPYNDLRENDKVKDRNAVRHYPDIVKRAGFLIRIEGDKGPGA